jgi:hypothetical protein
MAREPRPGKAVAVGPDHALRPAAAPFGNLRAGAPLEENENRPGRRVAPRAFGGSAKHARDV